MLLENITFPINPTIFGVEISSHLILYYIAVFVGIRYYFYLKKKNKSKYDTISLNDNLSIFIGAILGALIGSRIVAIFEDLSLLSNVNIIYFIGVQSIVGGLVGGLIGVEIAKKIIGIKHSTGDNFTYPLILAIIIGRIGCFLEGVGDRTVGITTNLPWGMNQGDLIARHPTSLYEILFLIVLWIFLLNIEKSKKLITGDLFKIFMFSYLTWRFLIEFIKPNYTVYFGISSIQIVCLIGILYYANIYIKRKINLNKHGRAKKSKD